MRIRDVPAACLFFCAHARARRDRTGRCDTQHAYAPPPTSTPQHHIFCSCPPHARDRAVVFGTDRTARRRSATPQQDTRTPTSTQQHHIPKLVPHATTRGRAPPRDLQTGARGPRRRSRTALPPQPNLRQLLVPQHCMQRRRRELRRALWNRAPIKIFLSRSHQRS